MPKFRYLALATAGVMVLAAPASAAYAASAHPAASKSKPVLTIKKKGGTAVEKGAKLTASLVKGTKVHVALGSPAVFTITCKSSSLKAKVTANPSRPGKATLDVTGWSIGKCPKSVSGVTLNGIAALNLPYDATVSTKGDAVTISGHKKSKPVGFEASVTVGSTSATCRFTAAAVSGLASNTGNKVSFSNQSFTLAKHSSALCKDAGATTATMSAAYGPVRDTSVHGSPKVFIS
jgi:hypothetical protein